MQLTGLVSVLVLATAALSAQAANTTTPAYYCKTDADCASFPNTVCITVVAKDPISKCTPNTVKRPACRNGQFGMCPSYQDTSRGYLNAQCIFVADDSVAPAAATTTTATRQLATTTAPSSTTAAPAATVKAAGSSSGSTTTVTRAPLTVTPDASTTADGSGSASATTTDTSVGDSSGSDDTQAAAVKSASYKIGNQTVYGIFECADLSECDNLAADPTTCRPAKCGDSGSVHQCNDQGTCTHTSKQDVKTRSCMCYKGFSGTKCEKTDSGACDVDCGLGGDCVDGECACRKGWDGKKYNGKQGKADARCTKCTNDLACENSNSCNTETGTCDCGAGYTGTTCGGVEDACVKKTCGTVGKCLPKDDNTAVCMCPICDPDCTVCPTKDCSTCPSAASSVSISLGALLVAAFAALMMG